MAVRDGRIVEIGPRLQGDVELDASGQVVAPGFVDIHSHYDAQVFWDPSLTPSSFHGVTSVVAGNCGFSIAPIKPEAVSLLARTLQNVEDMSFETLSVGVPWGDFETFPQYLDAIERRGVGLNFGCYVGHTAVRLYVMGDEAYERAATDEELRQMQTVIAAAMDGGAIGFASSASPTHNGEGGRPVPSRVADLAELTALLEPLREADRGVVALLPGGVISFDEVFDLQARIQRPFTWTALLTVKGFPYHEKLIERHDQARAAVSKCGRRSPCRPLVFQMNLLQPFTMNTRESFSRLMALDVEGRIAHYRDPEWRATALADLGQGIPFNWQSLSVAESEKFPELVGRKVVDLAAERGCTPLDVMLDVSLDDHLQTRFWSVLANDDPDAIALAARPGRHPARAGRLRCTRLASSAMPASPPTCSATGSVSARCCRSSGPSTSSPGNRPACSDSPIAARSRRARPPTCASSTPTPSTLVPSAGSTTSRRTASASRLTRRPA